MTGGSETGFLVQWQLAAATSAGFFWKALWAFCLGYVISSLIQVFVSRERMRGLMGDAQGRGVLIGTLFGLLSSSCSFAALSTTRALFQRGAGLVPSLAFLLASTNLVIELGIVIALFLGWQFVVGEYAGGVLLILFAWGFVAVTRPTGLVAEARRRARQAADPAAAAAPDWQRLLRSRAGWTRVGRVYFGEWQMVWKDVLIGFTVAGVIAAFVPPAAFQAVFPGLGEGHPGVLEVGLQALVAPMAAFLTFIGSMGNIPLAALLHQNGVSFAGVMAFIFSDLVVLPVLRVNARYYGWRMSLYILVMLLAGLVVTALLLHFGLAWADALPAAGSGQGPRTGDDQFLGVNFWLNAAGLVGSGLLWWLVRSDGADTNGHGSHEGHGGGGNWAARLLNAVAWLAAGWLAGGAVLTLVPI